MDEWSTRCSGAGRLSGASAILRQVMKDPGSWSQHGDGEHRHDQEALLQEADPKEKKKSLVLIY